MKKENYFIMYNRWKNGRKIAKYSIIVGFLTVGLGIFGFLTTNIISKPFLYSACVIAAGAAITGGVSLCKYNQLEDLRNQMKDKTTDEEEYEEEELSEEPIKEQNVISLQQDTYRKFLAPVFAVFERGKSAIVKGVRKKTIINNDPAKVLKYKRKEDE